MWTGKTGTESEKEREEKMHCANVLSVGKENMKWEIYAYSSDEKLLKNTIRNIAVTRWQQHTYTHTHI